MAFSKLLVANRGEIAVRILRAAHGLGYATVAVYSEADRDAAHVRIADEAVLLGPPPARESYLSIERILEAAARTGADAVHPGYGFLAENAGFARACADAGICFVGPGAEAMALMGDKRQARRTMIEAGVPVVPGFEGDDPSLPTLAARADALGYPVLVKAAAGGGGRGMRRVDCAADLEAALASAQSEAHSAFGDGRLLLEKLLTGARHVEVQVLADHHGHVLHFGERDCSTQRRYQKVLEEAPSPAVNDALRAEMGEAAVAAARAIGYRNAGTVEFLLAPGGEFFFLEMNTRLQVEHPVTELVYGVDLAAWQLRIAAGEVLELAQADVTPTGHAIEARLYAEDPAAGHLPQTGPILDWCPPTGEGVRCDDAVSAGMEVSGWYDPMLGKIVAHGHNREHARRRLVRALGETVFLGPATNKGFLVDLLTHPTFVSGEATTRWVEAAFAGGNGKKAPSSPLLAAAAAVWVGREPRQTWRSAGEWAIQLPLWAGLDEPVVARLEPGPRSSWQVGVGGRQHHVRVVWTHLPRVRLELDGVQQTMHVAWQNETSVSRKMTVELAGERAVLSEAVALGASGAKDEGGVLTAPMAGVVLAVEIASGDRVEVGQTAVRLEAMKIETTVACGCRGTVMEVRVAAGDRVRRDQLLAVIAPEEAKRET